MAYYIFTGNTPQTQQVRQLKQHLNMALKYAREVQAESAQMTLAEVQAQYGVDSALTLAQWNTTISDVVTALETASVTNLLTRVGFTT